MIIDPNFPTAVCFLTQTNAAVSNLMSNANTVFDTGYTVGGTGSSATGSYANSLHNPFAQPLEECTAYEVLEAGTARGAFPWASLESFHFFINLQVVGDSGCSYRIFNAAIWGPDCDNLPTTPPGNGDPCGCNCDGDIWDKYDAAMGK